MRTTLMLDDDVLAAAKSMAERQNRTIGEVVSELARLALVRPVSSSHRNGLPLLPVHDPKAVVTPEIVNALRDEAP